MRPDIQHNDTQHQNSACAIMLNVIVATPSLLRTFVIYGRKKFYNLGAIPSNIRIHNLRKMDRFRIKLVFFMSVTSLRRNPVRMFL
jgi:hypothetical protein